MNENDVPMIIISLQATLSLQ